jgi:large conductance mechanosensitive channel
MWKEFKEFVARGNALSLAIGVIMGASFGKIVTTLVEGIIMPPIGLITGGIDFKDKFYDLSGKYNGITDPKIIEEAIKGGAPLLRYGQFINDVITFLIVAFIIFLLGRWVTKYFKFLEATAPPTPTEILLAEIRDLLKDKQ